MDVNNPLKMVCIGIDPYPHMIAVLANTIPLERFHGHCNSMETMAYMKSSMISPLVENGDRPDSSITRGKHL